MAKPLTSFFSWHWDLAGFFASSLCAIHCLTWPFLLALPALGSSLETNLPWLEPTLLGIAVVLAVGVLGYGYVRVHRSWQPLAWAALGFAVIAIGKSVDGPWEAPGTIVGGLMVAWSHVLNWRKQRAYALVQAEESNPI